MPWYIVWGHMPGRAQSRTIIADRTPYETMADAETAARTQYPNQSWEVLFGGTTQDAVHRAATGPLAGGAFERYALRAAHRRPASGL